MEKSGPEWTRMDQNGPEWTRMDVSEPERTRADQSRPERTRANQSGLRVGVCVMSPVRARAPVFHGVVVVVASRGVVNNCITTIEKLRRRVRGVDRKWLQAP